MSELHKVRLVRQFVEALKPEEIPEELAEILAIPEGRNYVDVEVPTATAEMIRDVADKVFWTRNERTHPKDISAAHVTRTLIEARVGKGKRLGREEGQRIEREER